MATNQQANPVQALRAAVGSFAKLTRQVAMLTKKNERLEARIAGGAGKGAAKNVKANAKAGPKGKRKAADDEEDAPVAKKVAGKGKKIVAKKGVAKKVVAKKGVAKKVAGKGKIVKKGKVAPAGKKAKKDDDFLI